MTDNLYEITATKDGYALNNGTLTLTPEDIAYLNRTVANLPLPTSQLRHGDIILDEHDGLYFRMSVRTPLCVANEAETGFTSFILSESEYNAIIQFVRNNPFATE